VTGAQRAALARSFLGTPYRHQASAPGIGCDCLGLVRALWRAEYGREPMKVPPYRADWRDIQSASMLEQAARTLLNGIDAEAAEAGDIALFRFRRDLPAKHCGVIVAPGRFVHAIERVGVVEAALSGWWSRRAVAYFRFPES